MTNKMKTTTQHTPGPWQVIGDGIFQHHSPAAHLLNDQISRVATVHHYHDGYDPYDLLKDKPPIALEAEANARLISAAPELLAALERAANHLPFLERDFALGVVRKARGE